MTIQRDPPIYNSTRSYVTVNASFKSSGVDITTSADKAHIEWTQQNAVGGTFNLTPSADYRACNVSANQQSACQVDAVCTYTNPVNLEEVTEKVTIFFYATAVDDIVLVCS